MIIAIDVSEQNEGTSAPWWMIVDPRQNFKVNEDGVYAIASMIVGPFFSREEAEEVLKATRYNYGKGAAVFCASGYYTRQYSKKLKDAPYNRG